MATIIGAGQRYDRIIGVGGITTSIDGYVWSTESEITVPFPARTRAQGVAANGAGNVFVAISDSGYAAYSEDLATWSNVRLQNGNFTALGISWGDNGGSRPLFAIAGSQIYNDENVLAGEYDLGAQVAQVLINESGNDYPWEEAFTHPESGSWFHSVKWFDGIVINGTTTSAWVAVGHSNGQPDIWYTEGVTWTYGVSNVTVTVPGAGYSNVTVGFTSGTGQDAIAQAVVSGGGISAIEVINPGSRYDTVPGVVITGSHTAIAEANAEIGPVGPPDPYTWQRVSIAAGYANRPLYDVAAYQGQLYFSGRGMVITTPDLGTPAWTTSPFFTFATSTADFIGLAINPDGHAVAVSSGGLIASTDLVGWTQFSVQGYQFTSVSWFNDHWIVGSYSTLTQYTYWTSTDAVNWIPANNGIQMYGMVSY